MDLIINFLAIFCSRWTYYDNPGRRPEIQIGRDCGEKGKVEIYLGVASSSHLVFVALSCLVASFTSGRFPTCPLSDPLYYALSPSDALCAQFEYLCTAWVVCLEASSERLLGSELGMLAWKPAGVVCLEASWERLLGSQLGAFAWKPAQKLILPISNPVRDCCATGSPPKSSNVESYS